MCRVTLRPSVKKANTLPNENTKFDKSSGSKQKTQACKAAWMNMAV